MSNNADTTERERPGFYAVIPARVLHDEGLPDGAKILYAVISQLVNEYGYCFAENSYFAKRCDTSKRTVCAWISRLQKQGHIRVEINREAARDQERQRKIYIVGGYEENCVPGYEENCQHKNKIYKNTPPYIPQQGEECEFSDFWDCYAKKVGKQQALAAWRRLSRQDRAEALAKVAEFVAVNPDPKYRPDPVRWIKYRRWEDETISPAINKKRECAL